MKEITDGFIEGRVVRDGIAQSVTREGDLTRIRLTHFGGTPAHEQYGAVVSYELPEPVTVEARTWVTVEMDRAPEASREPMAVESGPVTIARVFTGPSAKPGVTQTATGGADSRMPGT